PRPNNGQHGRPSRPVCGSEPADLSDLAGRPRRSSRLTLAIYPADLADPSSLFFLIITYFANLKRTFLFGLDGSVGRLGQPARTLRSAGQVA
ncbi:hypothetical protein BpHYR1_045374, partial [Brachionus plicatilis]